jgi:hypothetical protein
MFPLWLETSINPVTKSPGISRQEREGRWRAAGKGLGWRLLGYQNDSGYAHTHGENEAERVVER